VIKINWDEFKEYKKYSQREDNFEIALDFLKSYYNMSNPFDMYDALREDAIGEMMLSKRGISDAEGLENYLYKL